MGIRSSNGCGDGDENSKCDKDGDGDRNNKWR